SSCELGAARAAPSSHDDAALLYGTRIAAWQRWLQVALEGNRALAMLQHLRFSVKTRLKNVARTRPTGLPHCQ
ncbi:MAG: hypothetical protein WCR59_08190, partial [Planctomycetota bacterium]